MIEWEEIDAGLRAVDGAKTELVVATTGWTCDAPARAIAHPVDESVSGSAEGLRLPPAFATLTDVDSDRTIELGSQTGPLELDGGEYLLNIDASIKTYIRFPGPAEITIPESYDELALSFPTPAPVTIGFRSRLTAPGATVTVPSTPAGLATALTHASSALRTMGPERSYPTLRRHPPLFAFGDAVDVPDAVASDTPATGIELRMPPSTDDLLVVAPLAYYLGASVTTEGARPRLVAPDVGVDYPLDAPSTVEAVPSLLGRVFWLDCLVRNVGPHGTDLGETDLLSTVGVDPDRAYEATPAERLRTYLAAPYGEIAPGLPEWHLAMYVEPTEEGALTLPYLLDRLSLVYPPETEQLQGKELMERSLDDFYRSAGPTPTIDVVKPKLRSGRVHGWLADGTPIDVFKLLPQAYANRFEYLDRGGDRLAVAVVLNDAAMEGEQSEVAAIYRERSADLPMDVTLHYDLTTGALADVFAAEHDFVHFIGHCETDGLRCPDGNLAVEDVPESNTQTFFLNACGSYYEGLELIRKGSVAGAVTFRKVLDRQAATVGTAFARLLVHGFSIERAIRLARRRIMMGKDYAVVGDGTHTIGQSENYIPSTAEVAERDDGRFDLVCEAFLAHATGGYYKAFVPGNDRSRLLGNETELVLPKDELVAFLRRAEMPTVYDGEFYWSDELGEELE